MSSKEAEHLACFFAIQDVVWIRQLLKDIDLERSRPTKVFINNQSARQLAMNPVHHQRSKHIDIKYHWIRDKVAAQEIDRAGPRAYNGAAGGLPYQDPSCGCLLATCGSYHACYIHIVRLMVLTVRIRSACLATLASMYL